MATPNSNNPSSQNSLSNSVETNALIELLEGKEQVYCSAPIEPDNDMIEVEMPESGETKFLLLFEVCCIRLKEEPQQLAVLQKNTYDLLEVETLNGSKHLVRVPKDQPFKKGFYGTYIEHDNPYKAVMFTHLGIKSSRQLNFLGTILEEQGMVTRETLEEVINDYNNIKKKRIGETIAEQQNLTQEEIEKVIRQMQKAGKIPHSARVGDILIASNLINREQLDDAIALQSKEKSKKIGQLLIERNLITTDQLLTALAIKFQLEFVNLDEIEPTPAALAAMPMNIVNEMQILPLADKGNHLLVATSKPSEHAELGDTLRFITNRRIKFVVAPAEQIAAAIGKYYTKDEEKVEDIIGEMTDDVIGIEETADATDVDESDSKIIKLINKILIDAYNKNASDIHLEPGTGRDPLRVRYRVDGLCHVSHEIPPSYKRAMLSRIKIMSNLDITERRKPQSGKILIRYRDRKVEYRVETTPTVGGNEDAVMRVLSSSKPLPISDIGLSDRDQKVFKELVSRPSGVILCVGPTGSGKTTTLHSALSYINTPERKIWTAEDPVEITQKGLRQVQINAKIGFTFQEALRSFLRSDPDVIMIGEMRDKETAKTAIEASLTGHVVFSTLHTNNAPETVVRLMEMGMDTISFSEALNAVIAQRLVRRLCKNCKNQFSPDAEQLEELKISYGPEWFEKHNMAASLQEATLYQSVGCPRCDNLGFRGRSAIYEMLLNSDKIRHAIKEKGSVEEIRSLALEDGMRTLRMDGVEKVIDGVTVLQEILRVC